MIYGVGNMLIWLIIIFLLVLLLPLFLNVVERNLEVFLFGMGLFAAFLSGVFNGQLFIMAALNPINITVAVFIAGILFKWFQNPLEKAITTISCMMPYRLFVVIVIIFLGLIASIITAIIAALLLVLIVTALQFERKSEVRFVVISCFSIGLGAALTPLGEPLSTIAISKLNEDFFFLMRIIGNEVIVGLFILGFLAALIVNKPKQLVRTNTKSAKSEGYEEILIRALKVYFFVMGLTFLGAGFEPVINLYFINLDPSILYWINMISSVLDNATLTAAEISPNMDHLTIQAILLGLLISGGMLIPGNIPNIIAAGKLQITSKEWAVVGFPLGLVMMIICFIIVF